MELPNLPFDKYLSNIDQIIRNVCRLSKGYGNTYNLVTNYDNLPGNLKIYINRLINLNENIGYGLKNINQNCIGIHTEIESVEYSIIDKFKNNLNTGIVNNFGPLKAYYNKNVLSFEANETLDRDFINELCIELLKNSFVELLTDIQNSENGEKALFEQKICLRNEHEEILTLNINLYEDKISYRFNLFQDDAFNQDSISTFKELLQKKTEELNTKFSVIKKSQFEFFKVSLNPFLQLKLILIENLFKTNASIFYINDENASFKIDRIIKNSIEILGYGNISVETFLKIKDKICNIENKHTSMTALATFTKELKAI